MRSDARRLPLPLAVLALALAWAPAAVATIEDRVPILDPANACDAQAQGCFGSVARIYEIGRLEVDNAAYVEFLNAVDPTGENALGLFSPLMEFDPSAEVLFEFQHGGIALAAGALDGEKYQLKDGYADRPVLYVSFFDAVRFANWLHNGGGAGDTETGAYTLVGGTPTPSNAATLARNPDARFFVPDEDEWYKAAYYAPASGLYYDHPAGTDAPMTCDLPGPTPNAGNCNGGLNFGTVTDVGSYTGSASPSGTHDQGGNVWEWNETAIGSDRVLRGGSWAVPPGYLGADTRLTFDPGTGEFWDVGFRLAAAVPACANGIDDDGDGLVDADDPGCDGPEDLSERSPTLPCDDGLDNDGDGRIDFPDDPGCFDPLHPLENPQCQDGLDNDGQFGIDFDGGASLDLDEDGFIDAAFNPAMPPVGDPDPQCAGAPWKNREKAKGCGLGSELALLLPLLGAWRWRRPTARGR